MNTKKTLEEFISYIKECLKSEDYDNALKALLTAIEVYPDQPPLLINVGNIYKCIGDYKQAENYYKKVLEIKNSKEAHNNLSVVYLETSLLEQSILHAKKAIQIDSNYVEAYYNLALAYEKTGEYKSAKKNIDHILKTDANNPNAIVLLFRILQNTCDWKNLKLIENKLNNMVGVGVEHPFMQISRSEDLETNYKVAKSWARKNSLQFTKQSKLHQTKNNKKVRIGYICGELRDHPTFYLIKNLFKSHNAKKFDIFIFSSYHDIEIKSKLQKNVYEFFDITNNSDAEAIDIINDCNLDILIDLSVVISNNRINILRARPAKKIISYLGFPGTSGYSHYDYLLTDKIVTPIKHQPFYTEKFLFLPNCYQINDGISNFSKTKATKKQHGLPEKDFILACFNQSFKLDKSIFDCWIEILKKLPNSVLWVLEDNEIAKKNLCQYIEKSLINKKRLIFAKRVAREEHLERIKLVDVVLDTRIYNGHTTTTDALQSGIPVVTKTGKHFASRVSSSLLSSLGLNELCCENLEDYKQKVMDICINKKTKLRILKKLTDKKNFEKMHDNKLFAKNLEKVLTQIL